ncbi:MAG: hypothetical protein GY696_24495 [Gammaproteobacteria bacterium]|nr:hypothetical protein [Gammaproteobacteria bacterium]
MTFWWSVLAMRAVMAAVLLLGLLPEWQLDDDHVPDGQVDQFDQLLAESIPCQWILVENLARVY